MPFPEPYAGLVIRYSYLWKREQEAGREEGAKDRPCAVVKWWPGREFNSLRELYVLQHSEGGRIELPTLFSPQIGN